MTCQEQKSRPRHTGKLTAGLLAALLAAATLAGCGGGGGGGGGGSSSGGGGGGAVTEATVVSPQAVTAAATIIGNLAANGVQVNIPANTALNATVTSYNVGIYNLPTQNAPSLPAGQSLVSPIFDIRSTAPNGQPDGGQFSQAVTVTIANTASLTADQLALTKMYYYDTTLSSWQRLNTNTTGTTPAGAISASDTHVTFYALFAPSGLPGIP